MSDQELDSIMQAYKATHPNDGEPIVTDHLKSLQINVPRLGNPFIRLTLVEQKKELTWQSDIEHVILVHLLKCDTWIIAMN